MKPISWIKANVCSGCRHNRYNQGVGYAEREGIDAPVTVDKCWSLTPDNIKYSRRAKTYYCLCGDSRRMYMIRAWEREGKRPHFSRYEA